MKSKNNHTITDKTVSLFGKITQMGLALLTLIFTTQLSAQDVYIGGYDHDGTNSSFAQIWEEDGTKHNITNGNNPARIDGVFADNGDVYAAGSERIGTKYRAKVWKNGIATNLTNGTQHARAHDIFVYDGDVYAAGYEENGSKRVAKLWKNGNVQNLTDGSRNAHAESIFVSNGDVYVVGIEYDFSVDGNNVNSVIKLWKNGTAQDLTSGVQSVNAKSVFVDGTDVYVAGNEHNGTNYIAKVWKNGNAQNLTDGSNNASAESVFYWNGDVYVVGYDGTQPRLWFNGVSEPLHYNTNLDGGRAYSIYVSGSYYYVAGTLRESNGSDVCDYAALWRNGQVILTSAAPACVENTAMLSVFVDDGLLSTETVVNQENSISLYPNPVQDILYLQATTENIQKIELHSIAGQKLQTWENQDNIDLTSYATGIYFVKVQSSAGINTIKIIKE